MGLGIYTKQNADSLVSTDSYFTNPFATAFDGRAGGSVEKRLFVRNDDPLRSYEDIVVTVDGVESWFSWKLSAGDTQPTSEEWSLLTGDHAHLPNLGTSLLPDIATYLPFWVRIEVPSNINVQVITSVQLRVDATELFIG